MTRSAPFPSEPSAPDKRFKADNYRLASPGGEFNTMNYGHTEHYLGIDL